MRAGDGDLVRLRALRPGAAPARGSAPAPSRPASRWRRSSAYALIYTPLKRRTPLATLVGGIPGALPPMIGWTAASGELPAAPGCCSRSSSCGRCRTSWRSPGSAARITRAPACRMLPVVEPDGRSTAQQTLLYAAVLVPVEPPADGGRPGGQGRTSPARRCWVWRSSRSRCASPSGATGPRRVNCSSGRSCYLPLLWGLMLGDHGPGAHVR